MHHYIFMLEDQWYLFRLPLPCLQLLNGLVAMDTTVLLEVVVGVMCREVRHAHEEQMQMKLVEFVRG